jgi:hypothetical protein
MYHLKAYTLLVVLLTMLACNSKPKVIEAENAAGESNQPVFQDGAATVPGAATATADMSAAERKVVALEALNTDKYTYIRVKENAEEFWIAITKRDIKIGNTYYFRGGLLKKNFQSQEFNRVFESVYLVGDFREEGATTVNAAGEVPPPADATLPPKNLTPAPGAIKIADLVANIAKYDGKTVKITGKCIKINPMIMGRNWLHMQDGSGKNLELTVTTTDMVQLGSVVTLEGIVGVNRDFGAGYKYDYIVESAKVLK